MWVAVQRRVAAIFLLTTRLRGMHRGRRRKLKQKTHIVARSLRMPPRVPGEVEEGIPKARWFPDPQGTRIYKYPARLNRTKLRNRLIPFSLTMVAGACNRQD